MNIAEHSKLFKAYVDRVAHSDLIDICAAVDRCWHEQLNGNANSQQSADVALRSAIESALARMLASDRDNIAALASRTINRT